MECKFFVIFDPQLENPNTNSVRRFGFMPMNLMPGAIALGMQQIIEMSETGICECQF